MPSSNLKNFRDFDVIGVKIRPFPLALHVGLITVQRYRAACDNVYDSGDLPVISKLVEYHNLDL